MQSRRLQFKLRDLSEPYLVGIQEIEIVRGTQLQAHFKYVANEQHYWQLFRFLKIALNCETLELLVQRQHVE